LFVVLRSHRQQGVCKIPFGGQAALRDCNHTQPRGALGLGA